MLEAIIFGTFAGLLLFSAIMVVFAYETIHRALWLVLALISAAALWILLNAEFLGLILILVYVGAVLTLFLFVIMTVSITPIPPLSIWQYFSYYGLSFCVVITGLGCILYALYDPLAQAPHALASTMVPQSLENSTHTIGVQLYTDYMYPFELVGILLLVAIVVSISLHSEPEDQSGNNSRKTLSKREQIQIKREDRIKLVQGD
jgi:NADH-quinone oxidoreductase subunit J